MKVLVTGSAGFIGNHVALRLLTDGHEVVGIDNLNPYYDTNLKEYRIARLTPHKNYINSTVDINDQTKLEKIFCRTFT
jgi:UDP-glucuronate 4-epimerase